MVLDPNQSGSAPSRPFSRAGGDPPPELPGALPGPFPGIDALTRMGRRRGERRDRRRLRATDPRWVLALRTGESLDGAMLRPDRRASLMRLGRALGLPPFEAGVVIAIMQDRARRGLGLRGAAELLLLVPLPAPRHRTYWRRVAGWTSALLILELLTVWCFWTLWWS